MKPICLARFISRRIYKLFPASSHSFLTKTDEVTMNIQRQMPFENTSSTEETILGAILHKLHTFYT